MKLSDLKVGDAVCIVGKRGWDRLLIIEKEGVVEKITATQITALGGRRWSIKSGMEIGSRYARERIEPLTPKIRSQDAESIAIIEAQRIVGNTANVLNRVRGEEAVTVAAMIPEALRKYVESKVR